MVLKALHFFVLLYGIESIDCYKIVSIAQSLK